ncbi:hypothetical protein ACRYJJ_09770 [Cylindrospermopsis raciborskii G7]|uniref:hypothetical protein n=1 Tax=Cylindrospermopsis raciborskii TaxID=77022 RepID=UPI00070F0EE1|nr:hypothetical protein ASL19_03060 [Cylindrospermopsis sp. CR12]
MLNSLNLENFKPFENQSFVLRPLTFCVIPADVHPGNSGHQIPHSLVSGSGSSMTRHFIVLDIHRTILKL